MSEQFWPEERDHDAAHPRHDPLGGPWGEEDDEPVEIEFQPVSDEEFVEDVTREEDEDDYYT